MDPADANQGEPPPEPPPDDTAAAAVTPSRRGRPRWLLPLVGLGVLVALGWWLVASQTGPSAPVDEAVPVAPAPEPPAKPPVP